LFLAAPYALRATEIKIEDATIANLQAAFKKGTLTSEKLTELYLARIAAYDKQGPSINTVITLNSKALAEAKALDAERKAGKVRGPLHGVPIVLKDNYDTFDLPTTAGSQLLQGSIPNKDAFVVKKLRDAGVVIIAKVNLSEFAAGGGSVSGATDPEVLKKGNVPNGFSSMGGQTLNPHDLSRGPAGSSGGTGASISAAFAQFGLGTDTAGSVRGPSAANGIVGLKTTLGLLSRSGIVPLSLSFDTAGPMARNVYDVAVALSLMTGVDPADDTTKESSHKAAKDYTTFLKTGSLKGARIGIGRQFFGKDPDVQRVAEEAIAKLKSLGAEIVDNVAFPEYVLKMNRPVFTIIRNSEFKAEIADYLKTLKPGFPRTLDELITKADDPSFGYRSPEKAYALHYTAAHALDLTDPVFLAAKNEGVSAVKSSTEAVFAAHKLDAIFYPSALQAASPIKAGAGGGASGDVATSIVNESGFPEIVVPAGFTSDGLPLTISFMGKAFTEGKILSYAYDFEQATVARRLPKTTPVLPSDTITY
jgi:amidase